MVDVDERVILAPTTIALLTSHLYSLETMVDITRRTVAVDANNIIEKTLIATSKLDEIRTHDLIVRHMKDMGLDKEVIMKMMDNAIKKIPKSPPENIIPEETTPIQDNEKTTPADEITILSNQENTKPIPVKEESPDVWDLDV
jgi:hypothetical protein